MFTFLAMHRTESFFFIFIFPNHMVHMFSFQMYVVKAAAIGDISSSSANSRNLLTRQAGMLWSYTLLEKEKKHSKNMISILCIIYAHIYMVCMYIYEYKHLCI